MKIEEAITEIRESGLYGNQVHTETLELALEALEKQIPITAVVDCTEDGSREVFCRVCGQVFDTAYKHCHNCGQKIDWKE